MPKVHDKQTATILAISGRRMTVDANGAVADYNINQTANITLNDKKVKLADLENGDEVQLGGVSPKGVDQVRATRDESQPLPKSITPNTTAHFPPRKDDKSVALEQKHNKDEVLEELREAANATNQQPERTPDVRKAESPDLPSGDKSTDDDASSIASTSQTDSDDSGGVTTRQSTPKTPPTSPVRNPRKHT